MDSSAAPKQGRVLTVFSLVMINIIAVDSLRTLPIGAEYGFSLVFYYGLAALIFFIPIALVTAELATGWPATGGLYVWVREAFGERIGFFTIWLQWVYNVVWYPTILAFIAGTFAYLFDPTLVDNKLYMFLSVLGMFWGATFLNCLGMKASSIISTLGAILGTMIPMGFIIILGIIWFVTGRPEQIEFTYHSVLPDLSSINNLAFISAVLFGLIGIEMSGVHAEEVRDPSKDYPKALVISAIFILLTLVLSSLAISMVVPHDELNLVSGLMDAFERFFQAYNMTWMNPVIAVLIIIGGISGVSTWVIGPTKGLLAATRDGSIPPYFKRVNKKGVPVTILILQGVIFSVMSMVFIFMPTISSSYWLLSALTAQLALIVYIVMFAAAIKLRYSQPNTKRAYRVPGNKTGMWIVAGVGIVTCTIATFLGFLPPREIDVGNLTFYETFLVSGIIIFCLIPLVLYAFRKDDWHPKEQN